MRLKNHATPKKLKEANLLLLLEGAKQAGGGAELLKRTRARASRASIGVIHQSLSSRGTHGVLGQS